MMMMLRPKVINDMTGSVTITGRVVIISRGSGVENTILSETILSETTMFMSFDDFIVTLTAAAALGRRGAQPDRAARQVRHRRCRIIRQ